VFVNGTTAHKLMMRRAFLHRSGKTVNQGTSIAVGTAHNWQNRVFSILAGGTPAYFPLLGLSTRAPQVSSSS